MVTLFSFTSKEYLSEFTSKNVSMQSIFGWSVSMILAASYGSRYLVWVFDFRVFPYYTMLTCFCNLNLK